MARDSMIVVLFMIFSLIDSDRLVMACSRRWSLGRCCM